MQAELYRIQIIPASFDDAGAIKKPAKGRVTFDFDPESADGRALIATLTTLLSDEYINLECQPIQIPLEQSATITASDASAQLETIETI